MAKDNNFFKFSVGNIAVCVEGGQGYGSPTLHDTVTLSVREVKENGKLGGRQSVIAARRTDIAAIGMSFLDVARTMAPETMWARSDTVATSKQQPKARPLTVKNREDMDKFVDEAGADLVRSPAVAFEKLRQRMPILQRLQYLLERTDDGLAEQLEILLMVAEQTGKLPFEISLLPAGMVVAGDDDPVVKH